MPNPDATPPAVPLAVLALLAFPQTHWSSAHTLCALHGTDPDRATKVTRLDGETMPLISPERVGVLIAGDLSATHSAEPFALVVTLAGRAWVCTGASGWLRLGNDRLAREVLPASFLKDARVQYVLSLAATQK